MTKMKNGKNPRKVKEGSGPGRPKKKMGYAERVSLSSPDIHDDMTGNTISIEVDGVVIMATRVATRKYGLSSSEESQAVELFGELSQKWG